MGANQDIPLDGQPPERRPRHRRRHRFRRATVVRFALLLLLGVGAYLFLPTVAGLAREAEVLRHFRPLPMVVAVVLEASSLLLYTLFYRQVLAAMGQPTRFRLVFDVVMASFLVSHVAVGGSATGVATNVDAMGRAGVDREAAAEAVGFATLLSSLSLLFILALGLALSLRHEALSPGLLALAALGELLVVSGFVLVVVLARHPDLSSRLGRWIGRNALARKLLPHRNAAQFEASARRLAERAGSAVSRRHFVPIMLPAVGELLLDAGALYLFFLAVGYVATPGSVLVAYAVANVLAALPITPSGLGVIEGSLTAIMVAYGAPARIAVPAVLGYRLVNFWLPLPVGGGAYLRLRATGRGGRPPASTGPSDEPG